MEHAKPNTLSDEHYERLGSLYRILGDHIELHIRAYGNVAGLADTLNAVCRLLASVVVQTAKIDHDVFDKINGMLSYHIYEEARSERDLRVSNTN
jgi:tRNA G37 N-methylase TrmD